MKTSTVFGAAVCSARLAQRLTQAELAEAAGVDGSYISAIESGRSLPHWSTAVDIAVALGAGRDAALAAVAEGVVVKNRAGRFDALAAILAE